MQKITVKNLFLITTICFSLVLFFQFAAFNNSAFATDYCAQEPEGWTTVFNRCWNAGYDSAAGDCSQCTCQGGNGRANSQCPLPGGGGGGSSKPPACSTTGGTCRDFCPSGQHDADPNSLTACSGLCCVPDSSSSGGSSSGGGSTLAPACSLPGMGGASACQTSCAAGYHDADPYPAQTTCSGLCCVPD